MRSALSRSRLFAAVDAAIGHIARGLRSFFAPAKPPARCEPMEGRVMLSATDPFGSGSHYFDQAPFSTSTLGVEVAQADPNAVGTTDAAVSLTVISGGKRLNSSGHNRGLPSRRPLCLSSSSQTTPARLCRRQHSPVAPSTGRPISRRNRLISRSNRPVNRAISLRRRSN
jgi:hypothetical protein